MVIKIYVLALKSSLHQQMPLAWKKGTILFTSNNCFYQMCKRIL
ncbi:hypothetical protein [Faecalibacillus faecis]|nr:hypothetical protein [Faecalibacillus faecis]MCQ5200833.1 hypothetical protein [Faecalibacillus faecis]